MNLWITPKRGYLKGPDPAVDKVMGALSDLAA